MSLETLRALERCIEREIPSFEIRFKNESKLMQAIGALVYSFNPAFLYQYTTTLGSKVYFPSKVEYETIPDSSLVTLAHEFVHMYDNREAGWLFQLKYAAPQVYAVPVLLLYAILGSAWPVLAFLVALVGSAIVAKRAQMKWLFLVPAALALIGSLVWAFYASSWLALLFIAGLACLGPWPSSGRTQWELRGYVMTIAVQAWNSGQPLADEYIARIAKHFTGPDYWYMARGSDPEFELRIAMNRALKGSLETEKPYSIVHDFLIEQRRISGRPL